MCKMAGAKPSRFALFLFNDSLRGSPMFDWLLDLIGYEGRGHDMAELARRLGTLQ